MAADELLELVVDDLDTGQRALRQTLRQLVRLTRPELSEAFEGCPGADREPFVFQHFAGGSSSASAYAIEHALAGYLLKAGRPVRLALPAGDDRSAGTHCYIPALGYIRLPRSCEVRTFFPRAEACVVRSEIDGSPENLEFEPPLTLGSTRIDVCRRACWPLVQAFTNENSGTVTATVDDAVFEHAHHLTTAFELLRVAWPRLAATFEEVVRRVVLFRSAHLNSFATPRQHGTAFLNVALGHDEIFLAEDLAHQCGHVLFFACSPTPDEYFALPSETLLHELGVRADRRSLYVALHGLVTEGLMLACLDRCLSGSLVAGEQRHELAGRLAFIATRLGADMTTMRRLGVLSPKGAMLCAAITCVLVDVLARRHHLLIHAVFSNQSYNFDYGRYVELNPRARNEGQP